MRLLAATLLLIGEVNGLYHAVGRLHARPNLVVSTPRCAIHSLAMTESRAEEPKELSRRIVDPVTRVLVPVSALILGIFTLLLRKYNGWSMANSFYFAATHRLAAGVGYTKHISPAARASVVALGFFHVALFGGLASAVVGETYKTFDDQTDKYVNTRNTGPREN